MVAPEFQIEQYDFSLQKLSNMKIHQFIEEVMVVSRAIKIQPKYSELLQWKPLTDQIQLCFLHTEQQRHRERE